MFSAKFGLVGHEFNFLINELHETLVPRLNETFMLSSATPTPKKIIKQISSPDIKILSAEKTNRKLNFSVEASMVNIIKGIKQDILQPKVNT